MCGFLIPRFCKVINICCFKILYLELTCYTVVANSQLQIHICMHVFMCMCGWVLTCSVVSDSLRPHGLQPTRLLCPWDSPGKNTGVGCHFLLQGIFPTQGSNLWLLSLLHWQARSLSLSHQMYVCMYNQNVHVCVHVCISTCMYVCVSRCVNICICIYIVIHCRIICC